MADVSSFGDAFSNRVDVDDRSTTADGLNQMFGASLSNQVSGRSTTAGGGRPGFCKREVITQEPMMLAAIVFKFGRMLFTMATVVA